MYLNIKRWIPSFFLFLFGGCVSSAEIYAPKLNSREYYDLVEYYEEANEVFEFIRMNNRNNVKIKIKERK